MDADAQLAPVAGARAVSVAFISSYAGLGGAEVYLERLLAGIERSWVGWVVLLGEGPLADRFRSSNRPVDIIPTSGTPRSLLGSAWRLRRLLRTQHVELIHANGLKAAIVGVLATAGTKWPVVWVRHDFSLEGWRARTLARMCRGVVCVSGALTRTFRARTFRRSLMRKVTVVHTGMAVTEVDRSEAHLHTLEVIGAPEAKPIVALVGQLVPGKGHLELIEISTDLLERLPHARIVFVGGVPSQRFVPYFDGLKARIEERSVVEAVTFLGHRDDAMTLIAGSDIVVMPSVSNHPGIETEGFPLLALEALAVGTPIVAYRVGGLSESVGTCGSLVEPGDRKGLLDAIVRVATDPVLSDRLSECGQQRVRDRFTMAAMMDGLQHVYRRAKRG